MKKFKLFLLFVLLPLFYSMAQTLGSIDSTGYYVEKIRLNSSTIKQMEANDAESIFIFRSKIQQKDGSRFAKTNKLIIGLKQELSITEALENVDLWKDCISLDSIEFNKKFYITGFKTQNIDSIYSIIKNSHTFDYVDYNMVYINYSQSEWAKNPDYTKQYYLNNAGGNPLYDIKCEKAWELSTGKNVKVAVIDGGVAVTHPDLNINKYHSVIGNSILPDNDNSQDYHGTMVSGIIGMQNNDKFGVGVAYDSDIIPIRIFADKPIVDMTIVAKAIKYAVDSAKVDIINLSSGTAQNSDFILEAVNYATSKGRDGKGIIIVAATGNENSSSVGYPAKYENVIGVGGVNNGGRRHISDILRGSNYGDGLDIMGFGQYIFSITHRIPYAGLYATGTSFATPMVSGTAALMLSINPDLTYKDVKKIICETAYKTTNYQFNENREFGTWNQEVGYGILDASKAVAAAAFWDMHISGPETFRQAAVCFVKLRPETSVQWSYESEDNINVTLTPFLNNVYITPTDASKTGFITIKATITYKTATKILEKRIYVDNDSQTISGTLIQDGFTYGGKEYFGVNKTISSGAAFNKIYNRPAKFILKEGEMINRTIVAKDNSLSWTYNPANYELKVMPVSAGVYEFVFPKNDDNSNVLEEKELAFTVTEVSGGGGIIHSITDGILNINLSKDFNLLNTQKPSKYDIQIVSATSSLPIENYKSTSIPCTLDINHLENGIYILIITDGNVFYSSTFKK